MHARLSSTTHDCIMFSQFALLVCVQAELFHIFSSESALGIETCTLRQLVMIWRGWSLSLSSGCEPFDKPLSLMTPYGLDWFCQSSTWILFKTVLITSSLSCFCLLSFFVLFLSLFLFLPAYLFTSPFFKLCFTVFGEKGSWSCGTLGHHRNLFKITFTQTFTGSNIACGGMKWVVNCMRHQSYVSILRFNWKELTPKRCCNTSFDLTGLVYCVAMYISQILTLGSKASAHAFHKTELWKVIYH